jgi:hypothetical protein
MINTNYILLTIDAIVNLLLGLLILLFPVGLDRLLGVPIPGDYFYTTILGAVIFGIGIALLIELKSTTDSRHGLGLGGAIAINFIGSLFLMFMLLSHDLDLPLRGYILLWAIVFLVFLTGLAELFLRSHRPN